MDEAPRGRELHMIHAECPSEMLVDRKGVAGRGTRSGTRQGVWNMEGEECLRVSDNYARRQRISSRHCRKS